MLLRFNLENIFTLAFFNALPLISAVNLPLNKIEETLLILYLFSV